MIDLSKYESESLRDGYVVANTANHLLNEYRRDSGVNALAKDHSIEALTNTLHELLQKRPRGGSEAVRIYACLVALTLKPWKDARQSLLDLDLTSLKWGQEIVRIVEAKHIPDVITHVAPSLVMPVQRRWTSTSSSTSISIKLNRFPVGAQFQGKNRTRLTLTLGGYIVPHAGRLRIVARSGDHPPAECVIVATAVNPPEAHAAQG